MNHASNTSSLCSTSTHALRRLAARLHRNRRGDIVAKVLLTIVALGGIIAIGSTIKYAMGQMNTQVGGALTSGSQASQVSPG